MKIDVPVYVKFNIPNLTKDEYHENIDGYSLQIADIINDIFSNLEYENVDGDVVIDWENVIAED